MNLKIGCHKKRIKILEQVIKKIKKITSTSIYKDVNNAYSYIYNLKNFSCINDFECFWKLKKV